MPRATPHREPDDAPRGAPANRLTAMGRARSADDPDEALRRVFGFQAFRGQQEDAVRHVVAGGDALVLMPTGGGKSLCYQVPILDAIAGRGTATALALFPTKALARDQLRSLGFNV